MARRRKEESGHRIPRNGDALGSLLLPGVTPAFSLIVLWCLIGGTPRGQP
jgi:hypothetical protein